MAKRVPARPARAVGFKERPDERILCICGNAFHEQDQRWYTPAPAELVKLMSGQHGWKTCQNCRVASRT